MSVDMKKIKEYATEIDESLELLEEMSQALVYTVNVKKDVDTASLIVNTVNNLIEKTKNHWLDLLIKEINKQ